MRSVRRISAVLVGFVFFLAGILKLMDPVGAGLVVTEYYKFLHLGFLSFSSVFAGAAGALLETLTGVALITGVWRRMTAIISGAMLAFFTALSALLLVFNPDMDCGCFGEAVHLTHTQSFVKNLVLCGLWTLAFVPVRKLRNRRIKYVSFSVAGLSCVAFFIYSALSVPLMDFTPFTPGVELARPGDEYPMDEPLLSFCNADGNYADSLATRGRVLAVSVYDADRFSEEKWGRLARFMEAAGEQGFRPLLLVAADPQDFNETVPELAGRCFFADYRTLMTLNRSNGGVTCICDGQIVKKWSFNFLPSASSLRKMTEGNPTDALVSANNPQRLKFQAFLLYVFAVMLLL